MDVTLLYRGMRRVRASVIQCGNNDLYVQGAEYESWFSGNSIHRLVKWTQSACLIKSPVRQAGGGGERCQ